MNGVCALVFQTLIISSLSNSETGFTSGAGCQNCGRLQHFIWVIGDQDESHQGTTWGCVGTLYIVQGINFYPQTISHVQGKTKFC
jgi:hypothetical protein